MTGLDCLREEMKKRGLCEAQINSKTAAVVLDILSETGYKYTKMYEEEQEASERLRKINREITYAQNELAGFVKEIQRCERELKANEERRRHCEDYIQDFYNRINDCETAEERDAMKVAQMFVNSVNVQTKYDNTAYIIGLASILSNGKVKAIDELKKINKKLPAISEYEI